MTGPEDPESVRMRARAAAAAREARLAAVAARDELSLALTELDALRRTGGQPRVVFVSGEPDTPGNLYRVERPAEAARAAGASVLVLRPEQVSARLPEMAACTALVLWRAAWSAEVAAAVAAARAGGAKLVFDLDDLMIDPALARPTIIDGIRTQNLATVDVAAHYERVRATMLQADFCLASTDELATHLRRHAKPTLVLPNGFDAAGLAASRRALRAWRCGPADSLLRIGYAAGSRTHQRDFAQAAHAVAEALRARPDCRLVLFRAPAHRLDLIELAEFPAFGRLADRIEWRDMVSPPDLPAELARFDVNIVPLEQGNPFCEAKSELKYFEAALVEVPTIASATGPFRRAIAHGRTGYLASTPEEWRATLAGLLDDAEARRRIGRAAYLDVLWRFGPERRTELLASVLEQLRGGAAAARAFELEVRRAADPAPVPDVPDSETIFLADALGSAEVTVVVPLFDYAAFVGEALDSVAAQTLCALDLVVVDDCSTDEGLEVVLAWAERHQHRFNRIEVRRTMQNVGLGLARNVGFAAAETAFVLPLDADNRLRPACCEQLLAEARRTGAAFVYPAIQEFGGSDGIIGTLPYAPARLIGVPYIDAMALVRVAAWAGVGGYCDTRLGWEDYDFWCRMAERGMAGAQMPGEPLADYRVHGGSMLRSVTETATAKPRVLAEMAARHPWLTLVDAAPGATHTAPQAGRDRSHGDTP
jgi:glycosyltransferase involved in cell wall biosynthesis